jgi:flavin reductase (DIM6/NTAB) family NADH-FMN oxidoreductase RutF
MQIDVASESVVRVYQTLVGLVTPRPIAWVTTISPRGIVNLAPFSFYNVFGANPPVAVISPTLTRDGRKKDTLVNVESTGELVINAACWRDAERINRSSASLGPEESEVDLLGLATHPSTQVAPPRLADTAFAMECKVRQVIPVGDGPISANLIIAEIVSIYIQDGMLDPAGMPDPRKIDSIARLGGDWWARSTDLFTLQRPL